MLHGYLRQSTASQVRTIGPFVDDTDFKTLKTALTPVNTDIKLMKNGAAGASKNSGGATHNIYGMYALTFDATDTNTVGELSGICAVSGALAVAFKFFVLPAAVFDAYFASTSFGYSTAVPTGAVPIFGITDSGTAQAGAAGTITYRAAASLPENSGITELWSGTGAYQARASYSWNNTTKVDSISPNWTTNPDSTSGYICRTLPPMPTDSSLYALVDLRALGGSTTALANLKAASDGTGYNLGGGSVVAASVTGAVGSLGATAITNVTTGAANALTATLADSVPADGTRPSLAQAMYMTVQYLYERGTSGTTMTVRKVDGSTALMTLTLNDADSPTNVTRTT